MMQEVDVESVAGLSEFRLEMVGAVEVSLDLEVRSIVQHPLPASQQVPSRQLRVGINGNLGGRRIECVLGRFPSNLTVNVALKREGIASAHIPVRAEPGLAHSPIIEIPAIRMKSGAACEAHAVHTIVEAPPVPATVADGTSPLVSVAATQRHHRPVGIFGALGDDIADAVDGICSPNGAARSPDHLNALNVLERSGLHLPIHAREQRRINAASVDHYQQLTG